MKRKFFSLHVTARSMDSMTVFYVHIDNIQGKHLNACRWNCKNLNIHWHKQSYFRWMHLWSQGSWIMTILVSFLVIFILNETTLKYIFICWLVRWSFHHAVSASNTPKHQHDVSIVVRVLHDILLRMLYKIFLIDVVC